MKQCPVCGALHGDEQAQCACGADLTRQQPLPPPVQAAPPVQMGSLPPVPPFAGRPFAPSPPRPAFVPKTYTWADVLTVLGFTAALTGYFRAGILLLPLGLVASLAGFWGNKQRGLAVAGVVISAVGLLLEIMSILEKNCLLPYWLTDGVFSCSPCPVFLKIHKRKDVIYERTGNKQGPCRHRALFPGV